MSRSIMLAAVGAVAALAALSAAPAEAGQRGRFVKVEGPNGRGYERSREVSRRPGDVAMNRSFQTNDGRGVEASRAATWGDGVYEGGASRSWNNGQSTSRQTSVIDNDDGSWSYDHSRTGVNGDTRSVSGTWTRPGDR
jgi:hypothetical protein